jgi:chondroitin sulfate synthase
VCIYDIHLNIFRYVRGDRLEALLRSLDPSRPLFIGQAGQGTSEEYGTLSLAHNENYCMGGPGIILSRAAMKLYVGGFGEGGCSKGI